MYNNISDSTTIFLIIAFLFMIGSMLGWIIELFYRRFLSHNNPSRKWINPGFLVGPCLPIYGFGLAALFFMSLTPYIGLESLDDLNWKRILHAILAMGVTMTIIEYLAGLIFIKRLKIKLWDYSDRIGNIQGIICPTFSLIWTILSAVFYFFIQPYVIQLVVWFGDNIAFSFVVGMFYGILIIDLSYSFNVMNRVRHFAKENDIIIKYEVLKEEIRRDTDEIKKRWRFLLAFNPHEPLNEKLEKSIDAIRFDQKKRNDRSDSNRKAQ